MSMQVVGFRIAWLLFAMLLPVVSSEAAKGDIPAILWTSDPVQPDETLMLIGHAFAADATIEVTRLKDEPGSSAGPPSEGWTRLAVLQHSESSLKAVLPAKAEMGVFACRVVQGGNSSAVTLVNAPDPWWAQGDGGAVAHPGGWVRVFGRCLSLGDRPAKGGAVMQLRRQGGGTTTLACQQSSPYALTCALAANVAPGVCTVLVHNGCGNGSAWREAGTIEIQAAPVAGELLDAGKLGVEGALAQAGRKPGAVVFFPRGHYQLKGPLSVPPGTTLRGEREDLVSLSWGDLDKVPDALISGERLGIEELTIYVQNSYRQLIRPEKAGFRMHHVRVRADPLFKLGNRDEQEFRGRSLKEPLSKVGAVVLLRHVTGFAITDCDLFCGQMGIQLDDASHGLIARSRISYGRNGLLIEASDHLIIEDNDVVGADLSATGNYIATYNGNAAECIYLANNRFAAVYGYDRETLTFDAAGGAYLGRVASVSGVTVELAADPEFRRYAKNPVNWVGTALCVMDGTGAGQYRRVVKHSGRTWEIDRPFAVLPDTSSVISIVPFRGRVLIVGNAFDDGGAVQLYGMSIDCILAANRGTRMGGFASWGKESKGWGWQPSWYCQFLDTQVLEGNAYGGGGTAISATTSVSEQGGKGVYSGPLCRGLVMRRNRIASNGRISVGGNTLDALVEHCDLEHSERGIEVGGETRQVLLRGNRFTDVDKHLSGEGLGRAVVVDSP